MPRGLNNNIGLLTFILLDMYILFCSHVHPRFDSCDKTNVLRFRSFLTRGVGLHDVSRRCTVGLRDCYGRRRCRLAVACTRPAARHSGESGARPPALLARESQPPSQPAPSHIISGVCRARVARRAARVLIASSSSSFLRRTSDLSRRQDGRHLAPRLVRPPARRAR